MNLNNAPTKEELRSLLASQDDNAGNHVLWVDSSGNVVIEMLSRETTSADWSKQMKNNYKFRFESFGRGNGYVGIAASNDEDWVSTLYNRLVKAWQQDEIGFIDT
jgi:hypothetical protein